MPWPRHRTWVRWLVLPAQRGFGTGSAPAVAPRELDQLSHFSRMKHDWCRSQIHLPLPFLSRICISPLGSSFPALKGLFWGLLPPTAPFRSPPSKGSIWVPPRAPCGVPPLLPQQLLC